MMENNKPRLSLDQKIQHLKDKGVLFNIMDEVYAKQYLKFNQVEKMRESILIWNSLI